MVTLKLSEVAHGALIGNTISLSAWVVKKNRTVDLAEGLEGEMQRGYIHIHILIFVYKTLTERNEEAWLNRNYDYEITNNINRQYASLCNILIKKDTESLTDMSGFPSSLSIVLSRAQVVVAYS